MNGLNTHNYDKKNQNIESNNNFGVEETNKGPSEEEINKFRDKLEEEKIIQKEKQCNQADNLRKNLNENLDDEKIMGDFVDTFIEITKDIEPKTDRVKNILNHLEKRTKLESLENEDIEEILGLIHKSNKINDKTNKPEEAKRLITLSKRSLEPNIIKQNHVFNCGGASMLFASTIKQLGGKIDVSQIYHHIITIMKIKGKIYWIDPIYTERMKDIYGVALKDITNNIEFNNEGEKYNLIKLKKPVVVQDTCISFHSLQEANKTNIGNYGGLLKYYKTAKSGKKMEEGPSGENLDSEAIIDLVENQLGGEEKVKEKLKENSENNIEINKIRDSKLWEDSVSNGEYHNKEIKKMQRGQVKEYILKISG